jgi:hypothetical protein
MVEAGFDMKMEMGEREEGRKGRTSRRRADVLL